MGIEKDMILNNVTKFHKVVIQIILDIFINRTPSR